MKKTAAFAALVLFAVAGCAGPASPPQQPGSLPALRRAVQKQTLTIRIRVPRRHRRAHYVSGASKGATLSITGTATLSEAIALSPGTNTISVALPAGTYTGSMSTYDVAPVGGSIPNSANLLSTVKNVPFKIALGNANQVKFTLDGVPASLSVGGFPAAEVGVPFTNGVFAVHALDADGYIIVGTYTTPITLVDTDHSGITSIGTSGSDSPPADELLGSNDTAMINYNGHATLPVRINASVGVINGFGLFAVTYPLIVSDEFLNTVQIFSPSCSDVSCGQYLGGGFNQASGLAADTNGNVFVADTNHNAIKEIPSGCTDSSCVVTLGGGFNLPFGVAVDSSDNVYVADANTNTVKEMPISCVASSACVNVIGGGFSAPQGIGVDASGNVWVGDTNNDAVKRIPPGCTNSGCVVTYGGGFSLPLGVTPDGSGGVFVADQQNHAVKFIPASCSGASASASCVTTIGGGIVSPKEIAYDGTNLFVTDPGSSEVVKKFAPSCTSSSCVSVVISNFDDDYGIAIP
jgi:hypothetical protein